MEQQRVRSAMMKRRAEPLRSGARVWGLIITFMAVIEAVLRTLRRAVCWIGLVLASALSLNVVGTCQRYFKTLGLRPRCSINRGRVPCSVAQSGPRRRRSCGLPVPASAYTTRIQSSCPVSDDPLHTSRLSLVRSKRTWYRSSAYASSFPARREDYMTDLKALQKFLQCEEQKERYALLCEILASSPCFWDYRPSMGCYRRDQLEYQYQVACRPQFLFSHRQWPPVEETRYCRP